MSLKHFISGLQPTSQLPEPLRKTPLKIPILRRVLGPFFLMTITPWAAITVWIIPTYFDGSLTTFFKAGWREWISLIPYPRVYAIKIILGFILFEWILLWLLPGKKGYGPITPKGNQPIYKFNGVLAWMVSHILLFGLAYPLGILDPIMIYHSYGSILVTLTLGAFFFCILLYVKGRLFPSSSDNIYTGYLLFDFFQGIELYPVFLNTSLKQLINCRVSMMGWSSVFIICLLAQWELYGKISTSMITSVVIVVIYLFKFFVWERGYLYSMDIMHDRFGYYICWGVMVWVPSVYCLVALYLVNHPIDLTFSITLLIIAFGLISVWINYDADRQRRQIRDSQGKLNIWGKVPKLIQARYTTADGKTHKNLLLASGWWGVARHFHYIPELALAIAWTLPVGFNHIFPWFYVAFLFILLMDRANRDERKCSIKYGTYWNEYKRLVPYKVWPGIY